MEKKTGTESKFRRKRRKKASLGVKNKPFKLHDYLHPSSGYVHAGGGGA